MFQQDKRFFVGFTLIELITVVAVIALLMAMLLPAVQAARSSIRRMSCSNKMRQIGIAIHAYNNIHNQLPPSRRGSGSSSTPKRHNILTFLLPYLELQHVYDQVDFSQHWSNELNYAATKRDLAIFQCPEAPRKNKYNDQTYYVSDYTAANEIERTKNKIAPLVPTYYNSAGMLKGLLRPDDKSLTIESVSDGLSNTMMFFECSTRPFVYGQHRIFINPPSSTMERSASSAEWASSMASFDIQEVCGAGGMQLMNCTNKEEIYSFHVGGANFLFGDGAVRFIQESIHPEQFISLFTATAGDIASLP
jgi:prepilin-type N-terminal cleavage/methylation domain-containing protein/prepilin-type processing-associated H-X9-DG protein